MTLDGLDDYNPILGLNSAGKSNILRALNLFFNGFVDEDSNALDLSVDFTSHAPKRKKRVVSVTVGFGIGGNDLHVRGQEEFQKEHGIDDVVYIRRSWSLSSDALGVEDSFSFGATLDMRDAEPHEIPSLLAHVRSVRYVYIPNHTRPAELIRSELAPLRPTLVARLRATKAYRDSKVADVLTNLTQMGDRMFGDVSKQVTTGLPRTAVAADLPADFADLVFTLGVTAITEGDSTRRTPEFEGSGAQSYMLLHILNLVDKTRRAGNFGWVQASVWAVEEPESFLHAGLRAQFSSDLREYANDERRQILVTTHQDEFVRVADTAWLATPSTNGTEVQRLSSREALTASTKSAITTYRHPLFAFPDVPLVIVEGKFDELYLRLALASSGLRPRWKLLSPSAMTGEDIGGDGVLPYLRYNRPVLASRPDSAPIIVVRDWEVPDSDLKKYEAALAAHPFSLALRPSADLANPDLGESFVGIERYLTTERVKTVLPVTAYGLETTLPGARLSISGRMLKKYKPLLAKSVDTDPAPGSHMEDLLRWIDEQIEAVLATAPPTSFG